MTERLREIIFGEGDWLLLARCSMEVQIIFANGYSDKAQMYFDWELEIEIVPWMILVVRLVYPFIVLGIFLLT